VFAQLGLISLSVGAAIILVVRGATTHSHRQKRWCLVGAIGLIAVSLALGASASNLDSAAAEFEFGG
jgi:hypothetical protein